MHNTLNASTVRRTQAQHEHADSKIPSGQTCALPHLDIYVLFKTTPPAQALLGWNTQWAAGERNGKGKGMEGLSAPAGPLWGCTVQAKGKDFGRLQEQPLPCALLVREREGHPLTGHHVVIGLYFVGTQMN